MSVGRASGKAILLGEHFVVYGAPALAVPLKSRSVQVRVQFSPGVWDVPAPCRPLLERMLLMLGLKPTEMKLEVGGDLPLGQGLGGSAALAVALLRAIGYTDHQELQDRAHALERLSHGSPSGIDDTVVSWERPVFFVKGEGPQLLQPCPGFRLWVATTGTKGSTKVAVDNASAWRSRNMESFARMTKRASQLATEGRKDLETGAFDALGKKMSENHRLLSDLGVSTPQLDRLVDAAHRAGAWGAKLTGAGLGGAIVALAPEQYDLTGALLNAGAQEVIAP